MDIELAQALAENELLKSMLYCTKRSCNNCGKVNCENFQRQRKDCCENWVSYKDYIKELEAQIEKMKNWCNCKNYQKCLIELAEQGKGMKPSECCVNCKKWEIKEND